MASVCVCESIRSIHSHGYGSIIMCSSRIMLARMIKLINFRACILHYVCMCKSGFLAGRVGSRTRNEIQTTKQKQILK